MKLFECQHCAQPLYFENPKCDGCGMPLGYLPMRETMSALEQDDGAWRALADPQSRYRFCANAGYEACNWLIPADSFEEFCLACRHNRMIPDLGKPDNLQHWRKIEVAKHRLFYTLLRLRLPHPTKLEDPEGGLAFDFLEEAEAWVPSAPPVLTGHQSGVITINIAEADDAERERQRHAMHEPYRTLLGHFRHEIAHYYWDRLINGQPYIEKFRAVFGDERQDYQLALQNHYANSAPADWPQHFVTSYASSHPWEDFAETWAHYFHMVDTLETASAFGLRTRPKATNSAELATAVDFDPHKAPIERIVDAWLPLTYAMNAMNRSMGLSDLYPFAPGPSAIVKLAFVHEIIHAQSGGQVEEAEDSALRAVVAGLKRRVAAPEPT
jgi:hypothetical protein